MSAKKKETSLLILLFLIGSALYLSLIFNNNLWLDEAFSAALVRQDYAGVLKASANDTLPPLYNLLNKTMTVLFGFHPYIMKLNSVVPMILTMLLAICFVRRYFGTLVCAIYLICLSGMPCLLYYGVEIRMYSWGLFFVTAGGIFAYDVYMSNRKLSWCLFILFSVGAGYTHHFAFVSIGFVYLFLLTAFVLSDRKRVLHWIYGLIATMILYFPCLLTTLKQMQKVSGYFSMPDITPSFLFKCLRYPFVTEFTPLSVLLLAVFLILPAALVFKSRSVKCLLPGILGPAVYLGTLAFGAAASLFLASNIFSDRYLVPSLGLFWLGFAVFCKDIGQKAIPLVFLLLTLVTVKSYTAQFSLEYKSGAEDMIDYFHANVAEDDGYLIYEDNYQIEICFRYYFPELKKYDWDSVAEIKGNIWYLEVPGYEKERFKAQSYGYDVESKGDFSFDRYTFHLYRLKKADSASDIIE
ncbi:hypothetical protein D7X88_01345 [bacterium C-53]|nr:hypothetical protein [Lachnospiraceae bacterium]NBI01666.1 hypothetical protein [Lachnospiraceae bacterium]RKJ12958.1 hypothetical protein D7X88_01345 [bacterium C-53]